MSLCCWLVGLSVVDYFFSKNFVHTNNNIHIYRYLFFKGPVCNGGYNTNCNNGVCTTTCRLIQHLKELKDQRVTTMMLCRCDGPENENTEWGKMSVIEMAPLCAQHIDNQLTDVVIAYITPINMFTLMLDHLHWKCSFPMTSYVLLSTYRKTYYLYEPIGWGIMDNP